MPLESTIVKSIIAELKKIPCSVVWKNHGSMYTRIGVPDIVFHVKGRTFYFEVKQPDASLSPVQHDLIRRLQRAGIVAKVVHSKAEAMNVVRPWL